MSRPPTSSRHDEPRRLVTSRLSDDSPAYAEIEEPPLSEYRDRLLGHKWLIAGLMALALVTSVAYVTFASPIYRANLLLQIEDSAPESKSFLTDTTGLGELKTTAAGEMQVIGSRLILGAAVDRVKLQINAQPRYVPIMGAWLARRAHELSNPGVLGMGGYVSGTERIDVERFNVPASFEDTESFTLTALGDERFTIDHELLDTPLNGVVGQRLQINLPDGPVDIQIKALNGKPGSEFKVAVASRLRAIERLQERLVMSEQGRQSNVINVALEDSDRARLSQTLNAIADLYVQQNMDRKSAEAEKTLAFLNSQLPVFEQQLKTSEDAFARFRNTNGTIAFDEEAKVWLKSAADLQTNLLELQQSRLDLLRTNNNDHPKVQTLNRQIDAVQGQLGVLNRKITAMPNMQRDALRLERDVRANSAQYQSMQNNALQMRLLREGKVGNVRLLDNAIVSKAPVKPQKSLIVAFALLLSALLGSGLALFLGRSRSSVNDSRKLSMGTGLELFAEIPYSREQALLGKKSNDNSGGMLADLYPHSPSTEALRAMRIALKKAMATSPNNRILITGATPGLGKSFVSSNFAILLAQTGRRVLLIDADMRKGDAASPFKLRPSGGLTELVAGKLTAEQAIHSNVRPNLDVLAVGALPAVPGDLFESKSFESMLDAVSARYDHVIIDTAPVLVAADAIALSHMCGCILLLARTGMSNLAELNECVRRLDQADGSVAGLLVNGVEMQKTYGDANLGQSTSARKTLHERQLSTN